MKKYKIYKLGKTITGTTPPTNDCRNYCNNNYQFVTPSDIKTQRYVTNTERYISKYAFYNLKSRQLHHNDIAIDCIGSDMGNVAIIVKDCISNQQITSITEINQDIVSPLYLYYLFSTKKLYFHQIGTCGSTMPIISKALFDKIEINIHELSDQQHIVNTR